MGAVVRIVPRTPTSYMPGLVPYETGTPTLFNVYLEPCAADAVAVCMCGATKTLALGIPLVTCVHTALFVSGPSLDSTKQLD